MSLLLHTVAAVWSPPTIPQEQSESAWSPRACRATNPQAQPNRQVRASGATTPAAVGRVDTVDFLPAGQNDYQVLACRLRRTVPP
jgi:hypothetical protein